MLRRRSNLCPDCNYLPVHAPQRWCVSCLERRGIAPLALQPASPVLAAIWEAGVKPGSPRNPHYVAKRLDKRRAAKLSERQRDRDERARKRRTKWSYLTQKEKALAAARILHAGPEERAVLPATPRKARARYIRVPRRGEERWKPRYWTLVRPARGGSPGQPSSK